LLDHELERHAGTSRPKERSVERVKSPAADRSSRGDRRLREEEPAEEALRAASGADAKGIRADPLEIEPTKEA
jgi:hypothetical protein